MLDRNSAVVPPILDRCAAISIRLLLVSGMLAVIAFAIIKFRLIVVPIILGLMISTVLAPAMDWLKRRGMSHTWAVTIVFAATLLVLIALLGGIIPAIIFEFDDLREHVAEGVLSIRTWLIDGPLQVAPETIDRYPSQLLSQASTGSGFFGAILSQAAVGLEIVSGIVFTIPIVFFFLKDGERIQDWCLRWANGTNHTRMKRIATRACARLGTFVRGLVIVALFDAIFIAIGLLAIGVPLVLPLAVVTFIGAFIPVVGATVAGMLAVLVALVTGGWVDALWVLGVVIAVQQVEGVVVSPVVMSRAVRLHPLAILLAIASGGIIAGVIGAFLAVPVAAVVAVVLQEWHPVTPLLATPSGPSQQTSARPISSPKSEIPRSRRGDGNEPRTSGPVATSGPAAAAIPRGMASWSRCRSSSTTGQ